MVLIEVAQSLQSFRNSLNLIQKDERAIMLANFRRQSLYFSQDGGHVPGLEDIVQVELTLQVYFVESQPLFLSKEPHQGGFPHLSRPAQYQGLAVGA